jgi:site-specific recombinase XerD
VTQDTGGGLLLGSYVIALLSLGVAMLKRTEKRNQASEHRATVDRLLDEYRLSLEALNRSHKTVCWYLDIINRYFAFLDSSSLLKSVKKLGSAELRAYILHLQKAVRWANNPNVQKATGRLSPYSVQGHVRAIKAFWSWLEIEGHIERNPLSRFPLPKVPEKPVGILSIEQIKCLLTHIDRHTPIGAKYYVILMLLLDTGLRISELVHIRIADVDLQHGYIQVLGKGQKIRTVPMSNPVRREINRYINHTRAHSCPLDSEYLFAKSEGTPISVNSVQQFLRRLAIKAGLVGIKCTPHIFRHTFATQSVANGANVFVLKAIMGHSSLQTTMRYTHLQPDDLRIQHDRFSPVVHLATTRGLKETPYVREA